MTDCWKYIDDYLDDQIEQYDFNVKPEIGRMQEPVDLAMLEIEEYGRYLDKLYNETGRNRSELYFRYPQYGRPYLKALQVNGTSQKKKIKLNLAYDQVEDK